MRLRLFHCASLLLLANCFWCCDNPRQTNTTKESETPSTQLPISANIYIENSGSMAGYCNISKPNAIETLVRDYYDRLEESPTVNNISLNYINTSIVNPQLGIKDFTKSIKSHCTAQYTKLDEMLEMMMDSATNNCVNILISDYVFTSDFGNLAIASSGITSQFSKQLESKDLAVAIFKYMVDFKGKYYPGGIQCNKPLPLYVWAFGTKENVRKIIHLPFNSKNCGTYFMQKAQNASFILKSKNARMIKDNKIHVSYWNASRHGDYYEFVFTTKLDNVLLQKEEILKKHNYEIHSSNSTKFQIIKIEDLANDTYEFTMRTNESKPAPGNVTISYPIITPEWVEESNFEGNGLPLDSTTYGISYLINGVSKSFENTSNMNNNYFNINIVLE